MGRIADALKRAEHERQAERFAHPSGVSNATLDRSPPSRGTTRATPDVPTIAPPPSTRPADVVRGLSEALVPYYERSSLITEQYRSLRTRLLSQNPHFEHRIIGVTSAVPKEGKSVTTLNLGCILAEVRHLKVLVVDGDFRRGSLAKQLNQPDSPGLAQVLAGDATYAEVIRQTPIPNLSFVPSGSLQGHSAAQLLTTAGTKPLFQRMLNDYHYTIVDTPPATTVSDAGIIGQLSSGMIMVVRLHRTDEGAAKRAVRLLHANNIPVIGCLLIGRDAPTGRYGFGYGYGYSYSTYYDYEKQGSEGA